MYSSSTNLDSPRAGILISALSNGHRVPQLYRLGRSKWRLGNPLYAKGSLTGII